MSLCNFFLDSVSDVKGKYYGPFEAEQSRGTNRQTGEQMTHWDMLNKATKFEFQFLCSLLFSTLYK